VIKETCETAVLLAISDPYLNFTLTSITASDLSSG